MTKNTNRNRRFWLVSVAAICLFVCGPACIAEPSAEILYLRRHFLDSDVNVLTYQTMDHIFEIGRVKAGREVWESPFRPAPLDFEYQFGGQKRDAEAFPGRTFTNALLIVKDGRIVFERYCNFATPQTRLLGMSMTKSFTSVLIGRALQEGRIRSVTDPITAYVPELKGTAYDGVTIKQALRMRTGADRSDNDQLVPGSAAGELREKILVLNAMRALDEAKLVVRKTALGGNFDYSTLNTTVLGAVLERATGRRFEDYMSEKLWQPLGAEADAYVIMDGPPPTGHALNGFGMSAVTRDFARFGLMMLNAASANGRQIVSSAWVQQSTVPGPGDQHVRPGASFGNRYQWWTVVGTNAYMALGLNGQFIFIEPDSKTVVVKLSYFPRKPTTNPDGESLAFFKAAAAWTPKPNGR